MHLAIDFVYREKTHVMKINTYRNLIDQIGAAVLILDDKGFIQYANQDSLDLLCYETEDQVLGSDFNNLFPLTNFHIFKPSTKPSCRRTHRRKVSLI